MVRELGHTLEKHACFLTWGRRSASRPRAAGAELLGGLESGLVRLLHEFEAEAALDAQVAVGDLVLER